MQLPLRPVDSLRATLPTTLRVEAAAPSNDQVGAAFALCRCGYGVYRGHPGLAR